MNCELGLKNKLGLWAVFKFGFMFNVEGSDRTVAVGEVVVKRLRFCVGFKQFVGFGSAVVGWGSGNWGLTVVCGDARLGSECALDTLVGGAKFVWYSPALWDDFNAAWGRGIRLRLEWEAVGSADPLLWFDGEKCWSSIWSGGWGCWIWKKI